MIETRLETAEDKYPSAASLPPSKVAEAVVIDHWPPAQTQGIMPPPGTLLSRTINARAEHGRWLADCPFCASAQVTSPNDKRFFCVECANAGQGGWVRVVWPDDLRDIESVLCMRHPINQNWQHGETVEMLHAENAAFGAAADDFEESVAALGVAQAQAAAIRSVREAATVAKLARDGGETPSVLAARGEIAHHPARITDPLVLPKDEN